MAAVDRRVEVHQEVRLPGPHQDLWLELLLDRLTEVLPDQLLGLHQGNLNSRDLLHNRKNALHKYANNNPL